MGRKFAEARKRPPLRASSISVKANGSTAQFRRPLPFGVIRCCRRVAICEELPRLASNFFGLEARLSKIAVDRSRGLNGSRGAGSERSR